MDIWEAMLIGAVGGFLANVTDPFMVWLRIDDAVGATCVHGFCGVWGLLSVGLFSQRFPPEDGYSRHDGLLHGGGLYLLGVQTLAAVVLISWAALVTFILLFVRPTFIFIFFNRNIDLGFFWAPGSGPTLRQCHETSRIISGTDWIFANDERGDIIF